MSRYGIGDVTIEDPVPAEGFRQLPGVVRRQARSTSPRRSSSSPALLEGYERTSVPATGPAGWWRWTASTASRPRAATRSRSWLHQPDALLRAARRPSCAGTGRASWTSSREWPDGPAALRLRPLRTDPGRRRRPRSGTIPASRTTSRTSASGSSRTASTRSLTYRGRGVEIDIPTLVTPSWFR